MYVMSSMFRSTSFASGVLAVLFILVTDSSAFWRMGCRSRTGLVRIDPLVSPGTISEHMHAIHGSSGFSETATYQELMSGDCTSCEVAEDKSAYWHPALYFQDSSTGKFSLVPQVGGMLAYYLLETNPGNTSLSSFPAGFQMIAGDSNQRNFSYPVPDLEKSEWNQSPYNTQAFLRQAAIGFNCLNFKVAPEGALKRHFLPDKAYLDENCSEGIRFELMFPSCWNGKKEIPPNKMDHMAYPSQVMAGECPEGYPERLPSLFYEIIWNTYAFKDRQGRFVISNGDPTGFGFHGDFIMGWDEEFLRKAVNTCTNLSGLVSDCPLFTIQNPAVVESCNLTSIPTIAAEEEHVVGDLESLPGNLPIQAGPAYAISESASANHKQAEVTSPHLANDPVPMPAAQPPAPEPAVEAPPTPEPAVEVSPVVSENKEEATPMPEKIEVPENATKIHEVVKVIWVEEVVTETVTETVLLASPIRRRSHMQRHFQQHVGILHEHGHGQNFGVSNSS